jgi:hypothetical protein
MIQDLLPKVLPYLEWIREKVFMSVANVISKQFELNVANVYTFLILIFSFWLSGKIIGRNYTTIEGRWGYLIILTGIIFWVMRYLGAN